MTRTTSPRSSSSRPRCACGQARNKYANECSACSKRRQAARVAEARRIVATGQCPQCGAALRHNLSLSGWWQCSQYGAEGFRADSSKPACSFQTFTE